MRVLLIGVGGGGCRVADAIYSLDASSRSTRYTSGIAVDRDANALHALLALPMEHRIYYQPLDPNHTTADLPSDMIITMVQNMNPGDVDAFLICSGLGGELATGIRPLVAQLKETVIEPVFGLFTLPCKREGDNVLSLAADELDSLLPVMDGILLFDNDLFYSKYKEEEATGKAIGESKKKISFGKDSKPIPDISPGYASVNAMIAKQINLLLRAGETGDRPGQEIGEVSLDAGEILNTMRGMGCIALGYARDPIPSANPDVIRKLRPVTDSIQESHQKALRIVEMAKRAISEGISISCEPAMAEKALILIAGPPHELSMRGYMTVRHWIDRTIRGQEVRSGDYPIRNTRFIAIIILLAGLEKVPKIEGIREIRDNMKESLVHTSE